jgi:hypothetical protein
MTGPAANPSERTGRSWCSWWLGKVRVLGFEADEPNARGRRAIRLDVEEPEPRPDRPHAEPRRETTR